MYVCFFYLIKKKKFYNFVIFDIVDKWCLQVDGSLLDLEFLEDEFKFVFL